MTELLRGECNGVGFLYTREQAPGALPNGTRIEKALSHPGDAHKVGDRGTVIGSMGPIQFEGRMTTAYFIEWDDNPGFYIGTVDSKIREVRH